MQRRGRPETTQKDTHVRENSSVISRLPLPPVRRRKQPTQAAAPTTPGPPGIVARARPPLAFPLLALAHGVAPHIHGPIGGAVSARRASIRTASDLLEASQPPSIRPPRSTSFQATPHSTTGSSASASRPRPPAMRLAARVQSPRAHALQNRPAPHPPPTNPSSASDAPPQTEAAAAGDGRRRREDGCGGGKGAADEGEVEGESGVEASSRAVGVGGGMDAQATIATVHRRRAARRRRRARTCTLRCGRVSSGAGSGGHAHAPPILKWSAVQDAHPVDGGWSSRRPCLPGYHQGTRAAGEASPAAPTSPSRRPWNPLLHSSAGTRARAPPLDLAPAPLERASRARPVRKRGVLLGVSCARACAVMRRRPRACAMSAAAGCDVDGGADAQCVQFFFVFPSVSTLPTRGRLTGRERRTRRQRRHPRPSAIAAGRRTSDDVASSNFVWMAGTARRGVLGGGGTGSGKAVSEKEAEGPGSSDRAGYGAEETRAGKDWARARRRMNGRMGREDGGERSRVTTTRQEWRGRVMVEDGERRQRSADEGWARKYVDGMGALHVCLSSQASVTAREWREEREWMGMIESESARYAWVNERYITNESDSRDRMKG
ncbi:hypothetical protein DFH09DRAFT_1087382 [Mycena vulgaris]|nr:hypothetical protein DFH09DRAFT_1087382 [Mycena vulgaris]